MKYEELLKLIETLDQSSFAFFEYNQEGNKIILSKELPRSSDTFAHEARNPSSQGPNMLNQVAYASEENHSAADIQPQTNTNLEQVKSPIVGVVYLQAKPDAHPFVEVGDSVEKGQTVCIIEAMKLMNEITAPVSGIVREILVSNEMVVEYDQPLITIEPQ